MRVAGVLAVVMFSPLVGSSGALGNLSLRACPRNEPVRPRFPAAYVPASLIGIWQRTGQRPGCVSVIAPRSSRAVVVWQPGRGESGTGIFGAAPGGRVFAIESLRHGAQYATIIGRDGTVRWRVPGHALGFTRQGALVIERRAGLLIVTARGRAALLVPHARLVDALGFTPDRLVGSFAGQAIAFGDHRVAFYGHADDNGHGGFRERALVVDDQGELTRVSPLFTTPGEVDSAIGGLEWSPDGRLWLSDTTPTKTHFDHDHCLDSWSRAHGYERLWCLQRRARLPSPPRSASGHFTALLWKRDGSAALLNNGYRVDRSGRVLPGRIRKLKATFSVRWTRAE